MDFDESDDEWPSDMPDLKSRLCDGDISSDEEDVTVLSLSLGSATVAGIGKDSLFPLHIGRPNGSKNKLMSKKTPGCSASVPGPAGCGVSDYPDNLSPGAVMAGRSAANFSACDEQIENNVNVPCSHLSPFRLPNNLPQEYLVLLLLYYCYCVAKK